MRSQSGGSITYVYIVITSVIGRSIYEVFQQIAIPRLQNPEI